MSEPIEYKQTFSTEYKQTFSAVCAVLPEDKPQFVVLTVEAYAALTERLADEATIPHEVLVAVDIEGANFIKAWRQYLGLSQAALAARMGMKQSQISALETKGNPTLETLRNLARAMNISMELLLFAEA